jgi:hypothetical protein
VNHLPAGFIVSLLRPAFPPILHIRFSITPAGTAPLPQSPCLPPLLILATISTNIPHPCSHTVFFNPFFLSLQGQRRRLRPVAPIPGEPDKDFGRAPESGTGGRGLGRSQGTARPLSGADNAGEATMFVAYCHSMWAAMCWAGPLPGHCTKIQQSRQCRWERGCLFAALSLWHLFVVV